MSDQKHTILEAALKNYTRYGIKAFRMEDLADDLGISKKTIYQHFDNKDDLVHQTVMYDFELHHKSHTEILKNVPNVIDQIFEIWKAVVDQMGEMNPACMMDLRRYYPKSWKEFEKFKQDFLFKQFLNNLELGIEQGYFREDINKTATAIIYLGGIESILEDNSLRNKHNISFMELLFERIVYHIRAIATKKGYKYLEEKIKTIKK